MNWIYEALNAWYDAHTQEIAMLLLGILTYGLMRVLTRLVDRLPKMAVPWLAAAMGLLADLLIGLPGLSPLMAALAGGLGTWLHEAADGISKQRQALRPQGRRVSAKLERGWRRVGD